MKNTSAVIPRKSAGSAGNIFCWFYKYGNCVTNINHCVTLRNKHRIDNNLQPIFI